MLNQLVKLKRKIYLVIIWLCWHKVILKMKWNKLKNKFMY